MIRLPQRSVTRFFIPMIDVLTLLFCMFLLMPIIRESAAIEDAGPGIDPAAGEWTREIEKRKQELAGLRDDQRRALAVLQELSAQKRELLRQHVLVQLLNVSAKDGSLWYFDAVDSAKPPLKIGSGPAATALIEEHKKDAGQRELLYIFQQPLTASGEFAPYPTRVQEAAYRDWFATVNYDGCVKPPAAKGAK